MKSGLEGRNNQQHRRGLLRAALEVSMKSGLEGRNNADIIDPQEPTT